MVAMVRALPSIASSNRREYSLSKFKQGLLGGDQSFKRSYIPDVLHRDSIQNGPKVQKACQCSEMLNEIRSYYRDEKDSQYGEEVYWNAHQERSRLHAHLYNLSPRH